MFRTRITPWDIAAAIAVVLCACLLFWRPWAPAGDGEWLEIVTPEKTAHYSLREDRTVAITSRGIVMEIVIKDGAAHVESSSCPDGVCRAGGGISKGGESILCAPAGVRLTVKGGDIDVDFVAG